MNRRDYVIGFIAETTGDKAKAETIVERLTDEGLLVLGYGDSDVERILETFKLTFGTTKTSKYDRFAAHRLADKYSPQAVTEIIKLLGQHSNENYVPVVNNITELEQKFVSVLHFLRNVKGDEVIDD